MADEEAEDEDIDEEFVMSKKEMERFKHAYNHSWGGKYNLHVQTPYLIKLADGYFARYKASRNNIFDALKAHALYNGVGHRCPNDTKWTAKAYEVMKAYWNGEQANGFDYGRCMEVNEILSEELLRIRTSSAIKLKDFKIVVDRLLSEREAGRDGQSVLGEFCNDMASISMKCTDHMIKLCELVIKYSLSALKGPMPCAFSVVALGSIAKGEATPYSDIEYLFLIEEKNEQTEKYFERLAMTSYFIISNLRETPLTSMAITELKDWFEDKQTCGFHIDGLAKGAGNIPTTNAVKTLNANILTPEELFSRYKRLLDEPNDASKRGDMTAMLHYTKSVFSSGRDANRLLDQFLLQRQSLPINDHRQEMNREMFAADANKFNFRPNVELIDKGYLVDVKKELYRYPSIVLHDISILATCCESNSWETLAGLKENGIISPTIHQSLFFLLACACYIRLSAYLFHTSHDDRLSVLSSTERSTTLVAREHTTSQEVGKRWYLQQPLFVLHCEHAVPLKNHIGRCNVNVDVDVEIMNLLQTEIESPNWLVQFQTLHCCHAWTGAWSVFEKEIGKQILKENPIQMIEIFRSQVSNDFQKLWFCIKALGYLLFQQREYEAVYGLHVTFLKLADGFKESVSEEITELIFSEVMEELGTCSVYMNKHSRAETEYRQSLEIRLRLLSNDHELVAKSHLYIGRCVRLMKNYDDAEIHLLQAAQIYHTHATSPIHYDFHGEGTHKRYSDHELDITESPDELLKSFNNSSVMLGQVLWDLGNLYSSLKYCQRAFNYFSVAQRMFEEAYGNEACHKDIAKGLLTLASSSDALQKYSDADRYFFKGTLVITQLFDPKLVIALRLAEKFGVTFLRQVIPTVFRNLPGYKVPHYETAAVGQMFSFHLIQTGHHRLAEQLIRDVIDMYKSVVDCDENNEEYAKITSFLGLNAWKCKRFDVAMEHFSKALTMFEKNEGQFAKLEAAQTVQNMGLMYAERKDYIKAKEYLTQARGRYLASCREPDHPKVLEAVAQLNSLPSS